MNSIDKLCMETIQNKTTTDISEVSQQRMTKLDACFSRPKLSNSKLSLSEIFHLSALSSEHLFRTIGLALLHETC